MQSNRQAANAVYKSKKFEQGGEFGELLLHAAIRQVHDSLPAISKIFYKTAANDTVKGFDAVHVVGPPEDMELWLGEAKFYTRIGRAVTEVVAELECHLGTDYLREEFSWIKGKIDTSWAHAERLKKLLSPNTSLDEVFQRTCIPVLLTYDSNCVRKHKSCGGSYVDDFRAEIAAHHLTFAKQVGKKSLPTEVRVHLFLIPLQQKNVLIAELDRKLKQWQKI
jgi:Cap4 SAVED domain